MSDRHFTDDHHVFRDAYRKFLQREIVPHLERWREQGIVDREAFLKAGEQGFLMLWPDEKYGGPGLRDFRYEQILIEETQYAMAGDWFNSLHSRLVGMYFDRFGSEEQRERFLPRCITGETVLAIAMTEPDAGSDLAGMRSTALDKGDHFLLNGAKTYISNGILADVVIVAAKSDPEHKHAMALLLVERGMEGFSRGRNLKKMGMKGQDTAELFFDNVKVPRANVLGDPAKGFYYLMEGLAEERLIGACSYVASANKAFDVTLDFVRSRKAFGKRIADFQNTQFKLAALKAELEVAECYVDRCVQRLESGELTSEAAAVAKLYASELLGRVADECVQLHGGAGYMDEYVISRLYTDARITRIFAGSSEIMKLIIGRDVLADDKPGWIERRH